MYFCLNMKAKRLKPQLIVGFILLLLICSCRSSDENTVRLSQVDSLMQTLPDSALFLLQTIQQPERMRGSDRAYYALLLTQANHKNYIEQTNDSLIQVAVDYYADRDDKEREAKAYYYLGCVQEEMNDEVAAIDACLKALGVKPKESGDTRILTMIYEKLGKLYCEQAFYDKAMVMYRASYDVNVRHNEKEKIIYPLKDISSVYMYQENWDSAAYYCNQVIDVARVIGDSTWVSLAFNNMAHICINQKYYEKARLCVLKSMKEGSNDGDVAANYNLLGRILVKQGQLDSARYYLSLGKARGSDDLYTRASSFSMLYELEKSSGNYKQAVAYNDTFSVLFDSIQELKRRAEVGKLIDNYALENRKRELVHEHENSIRFLFYCFFALVTMLVFTYLIVDKYRNRKYMTLQKSLMQSRGEAMQVYRELEGVNKSAPLLVEKENQGALFGDAEILRKHKFALSIKQYQETVYHQKILTLINKNKIEEKVFTQKERDELWEIIFQIFAETMADLKKQCPELTREDQLYCIFYILGYSNPIIFVCTGTNANALKTRKGRLKAKMSGKLYSVVFSGNK